MSRARALDATLAAARRRKPEGPLLIGVSGSQGSGKTTLARDFVGKLGPRAVSASLDDVYLSSAARAELARDIHPLFATRGPPGTHDLRLLHATLDALFVAEPQTVTAVPAFDKLRDEPAPEADWPLFQGRPDIVVIEGWCFGATAQADAELIAPINALEAGEDPHGIWRRTINAALGSDYQSLFARFDAILFLAAPSFDIVPHWRCEQQETLLGRALTADERAHIHRFVSHFERLTRSMLAGGRRADVTAQLNERREVVGAG